MDHRTKNRVGCALFLAVGVVSVAVAARAMIQTRHQPGESTAMTTLITISSAQAYFRNNDPAGDGKPGYWRGDVAGLYTLKGKDGQPIKLIEVSAALADDRPASDLSSLGTRGPKGQYWYRAIRHADEKTPDPQRFAACAFPSEYPGSSKFTWIVDETLTIFRKDLGHGRGVDVFPASEELKGWQRCH